MQPSVFFSETGLKEEKLPARTFTSKKGDLRVPYGGETALVLFPQYLMIYSTSPSNYLELSGNYFYICDQPIVEGDRLAKNDRVTSRSAMFGQKKICGKRCVSNSFSHGFYIVLLKETAVHLRNLCIIELVLNRILT